MEVLIVSKTHMSNNACVGGLVLADNSYVRLLNPGNQNQPADTEFDVGDVWDLNFIRRNPITPPHVEDVIVRSRRHVRDIGNIPRLIRDRGLVDWNGPIDEIFDGMLHWTPNGSGYADPGNELLQQSVGFWISDEDLTSYVSFNSTRYRYSANRNIKFVGYQDSIGEITAGTIIRLSLTRSHSFNNTNGCWLQLSGWY